MGVDSVEAWKAYARANLARRPVRRPFISGEVRPAWRLALAAVALGATVAVAVADARTAWAFALSALAAIAPARAFTAARDALLDERAQLPAALAGIEAMLSRGDACGASACAKRALSQARSAPLKTRLRKLAAWAAIGRRDPYLSHQALVHVPPRELDAHLVAAYLACCNRSGEAIALLEEIHRAGQRAGATTKLLVDIRFRAGDRAGALSVARRDRDLLTAEEWAAVESALHT